MARRVAHLVAALFLAGFVLLTGGPAAWAHATLVSTSPADGAIVPHAPARVTATFDEPVGVSPGSLEVFAPDGSRADTGGAAPGSTPAQVVVALKPGLGNGTYTVGWHVVSADSHRVQGAFTFSIGAPSRTSVNPDQLNQAGSPLVSIAFGVVRWLAFCCFALLIGAVGFVLWCWPAGASSPLVLRLTMGAWSGLAGSVLGAVLLQGVYGAGEGVSRVFWPDVLHATLDSRYGRALGARLILVIAALFLFTAILGRLRYEGRPGEGRPGEGRPGEGRPGEGRPGEGRPGEGRLGEGRRVPVAASAAWGVLTAALAATWAAADHAGVGSQVPLSLLSDTVHLSAVAFWLGGLTMLATIVLRKPRALGSKPAEGPAGRRTRAATVEAVTVVERFSPLALACVGAILVTGTYQAWRNVGSWLALAGTAYGRLLLIKIGAMCVLIGLGYLARIRITAMRAPASATHVSVMQLVTSGLPRVGVGARSGPRLPGMGEGHGHGWSNGAMAHSSPHSAVTYSSSNGARANRSSSGSSPDPGRTAVTLSKLRWSVAAETTIAVAVLAVTAVLVNTPTARETFTQPASAAVAFSTGGPGGRGNVSVTVTPALLGPNQVRVAVTGRAGRPYSPQQVAAALLLPARHLGPLPVPLRQDGAGRYASGSVTVTITGQWQLQITIRSDAFDETTVIVPVTVH